MERLKDLTRESKALESKQPSLADQMFRAIEIYVSKGLEAVVRLHVEPLRKRVERVEELERRDSSRNDEPISADAAQRALDTALQ